MDKLNNENLILKGNDVYLGQERIGYAEIKKDYRSIIIRFKIKIAAAMRSMSATIINQKGLNWKTWNRKIFEYKQKEKEYNANNTRWHLINKELYSKLIRIAVREIGEDEKTFLMVYIPKKVIVTTILSKNWAMKKL